jgi:hypothetical protein
MRFPTRQLLGIVVAAALAGGCRDAGPQTAPEPAAAEASAGEGGAPRLSPDATPPAPSANAPVVAQPPAHPAPEAAVVTPPPQVVEPGVAERPEAAEAEPANQFDGHKLAILHTANMAGELEPCG